MNKYRCTKLFQITNDAKQNQAYCSKGNTAVIAGPGSGKTTILTMKAMSLLENDILEPQGITCITYSREAAREIKDRLDMLGYKNDHRNSFFGTVHAFCIAEVLIPFARLFDHFTLSFPIRIANAKERKEAFQETLKKLAFDDNDVSIMEMNRERKFEIVGMSSVKIPFYDIALKVAHKYEEILHSHGLIDFEDIVNYSTLLIQKEVFVQKCLEAKFPWLFIDEYQDLGKPLHEIILSLLFNTKIKLFAVGDPDQSIYGFQGAIPDYLNELTTFHDKIETVVLDKNYRSNQEIINASEIVLQNKRGYLAGTRGQERAEFRFYICEKEMFEQFNLVAETIIPELIEGKIPLNEIAVLVGTNKEVTDLSIILQQHTIPYYIAKHQFDRTEFIQWLENCAKWTINNTTISFDELWFYWRFLLSSTGYTFIENLEIEMRLKLYNCLTDGLELRDDLKNWLMYLSDRLDFENILSNAFMSSDEFDNLFALIESIQEQKGLDLKYFSELGKPQNQVTISTRHSCKGLEFETVIMLGMEENRFPYYNDLKDPNKLKESARMCFVCISRAKRVCILVRSKLHTINTRRGPWTQHYQESRYWKLLENWQNSQPN